MKKFNLQIKLIHFVLSVLLLISSCKPINKGDFLNGKDFKIPLETSVFIVLSAECPICQNFQGSFKTMTLYGATAYYVFPGIQKHEDVKAFVNYDSIPLNRVILDPNCILTKRLKAEVTPEAVVLKENTIVYSGLINDRYTGLGAFKSKASVNYLENALNSLQKNEEIQIKHTKAIGCFIEFE